MNAIHTDNAPAAIGPYSRAIEVNGFVFASGQIPIDPATGNFVEGGIKEQTRQRHQRAEHPEGCRHRPRPRGEDYSLFGQHGRFCSHERGLRRVLQPAFPCPLCRSCREAAQGGLGRG